MPRNRHFFQGLANSKFNHSNDNSCKCDNSIQMVHPKTVLYVMVAKGN